VGNWSGWSPDRCTTAPIDDASLLINAGSWTRATSQTDYYGLTYTTTTGNSAKLKPAANISAKRLWLVADTCAACGSVRVYWNGVSIANISLVSASTAHKVLLPITTFGAVSNGGLTLMTTSTAKTVRIDGLAASMV
jgi:hypothetical protein